MNFSLPPLPDFNALHVLVVHFPIALLTVAVPVLLLLAFLFPKSGRQFAIAAGVMLVIGTASIFLAIQTGEAAEELAETQGVLDDAVIHDAIEEHSDLAESSRNIYAILTAAFVLYLIFSGLPRREWPDGVNATILALFLVVSLAAALNVANTAHTGGKIVHIHGILAPLEGGGGAMLPDQGGSETPDGLELGEDRDDDQD